MASFEKSSSSMRPPTTSGRPCAILVRFTRLAREFVIDTRLDGDSRLVTFANGRSFASGLSTSTIARRLAYAVVDWRTTHHNASFQVTPDGDGRSRLTWITDLLPDSLADLVGGFVDRGCVAIKRTLETSAAGG